MPEIADGPPPSSKPADAERPLSTGSSVSGLPAEGKPGSGAVGSTAAAGGAGSVAAAAAAVPVADKGYLRSRAVVERRLALKRLLQDGAVFVKYGRSGFPHKRHVYLSDDGEAVRWRKPSSKPGSDSGKECVPVVEITSVAEGPTTPVFARNIKSVTRTDCCFSLVCPSRTLDLEADTPEIREEWITAFLALQKYGRLI